MHIGSYTKGHRIELYWNGLLEWTIGMDYWNGHQNMQYSSYIQRHTSKMKLHLIRNILTHVMTFLKFKTYMDS